MATSLSTTSDFEKVVKILNQYFQGLYEGNHGALRNICANDLVLSTPHLRRPLNQWLHDVETRPIPKEMGEEYQFKILSLDVVGHQAMAKLSCPLLGHPYIDFIGLLKEKGDWKIVSKMYCER